MVIVDANGDEVFFLDPRQELRQPFEIVGSTASWYKVE